MRRNLVFHESGYSMIELIVTLALFGLLCMVAFSNITTLENPLISTSTNLSHYFRLVRVRAIAQTRSIKIAPGSNHHLSASTASNCTSTDFTDYPDLDFDLGDDVQLGAIDWEVCFTQRGLVHAATSFVISGDNGSRTVQIALGGGVKIQ